MRRDVLQWWLLRRVYFASLAFFNEHLGILRIPLDTISFKVNLAQRFTVKVASHKLVNPSWNDEVSQVKYSKNPHIRTWVLRTC